MDTKTLRALEGSIAKWGRILKREEIDKGSDNCPLCAIYVYRNGSCDGCPVTDDTGLEDCADTPYDEWWNAGGRYHTADTPQRKKAAENEIAFLRSLLPPETIPSAVTSALSEDGTNAVA